MAAKKMVKKSSAKKSTGAKRKPNAAFMKAMQPSPVLAEVVGDKPIPRTEVVKKLWAYIKKNNLQDAKERRMINADDKLRAVFGGKKQVSMFEMTKLVNKQLS
jgi:chromatin remodeling complex protein RSC6